MLSLILRFFLSVITCTLFISISGTQIVLANVDRFGLPPLSIAERFNSTAYDLLNFAPILAVVVLAAYLIGFTVAWLLGKWWLKISIWGFIAGLTAVPTAVMLINSLVGIEVFYITTQPAGWFVLLTGSVLGSMVFYFKKISEEINLHD